MPFFKTRKIFSLFGTKKRLFLCSNSQTEIDFFMQRPTFSVKKTKTRFVKKAIVTFTKTAAVFLVDLTLHSQIIYSIYVSVCTAYYICGNILLTQTLNPN